jgi:LmbE family N-acetylglucosaminyl deacetylase
VTAAPVLVVAPHGLDEILGCGGTMARHAAAGRKVHVLILCGNGTGHDGKRREAAAQAAALLGAEPPRFGGFPENRSDTVGLGEFITVIERTVAELKPAAVYVSHGGNLNIDHQMAFRAAATALRPMPGGTVSDFYSYEIPSSTDWALPGMGEPFRPTRFVDIAPVLALKMRALAFYAFDMRAVPHARSMVAVENLAHRRGASVGLAAVEAFAVLRQIDGSSS